MNNRQKVSEIIRLLQFGACAASVALDQPSMSMTSVWTVF
jgi:hypothetical protein